MSISGTDKGHDFLTQAVRADAAVVALTKAFEQAQDAVKDIKSLNFTTACKANLNETSQLRADVAKQAETIKALQHRESDLVKSNSALKEKIPQLTQEMERIHKQLQQEHTKNRLLHSELETLRQLQSNALRDNDTLEQKVSRLATELKETRQQLEDSVRQQQEARDLSDKYMAEIIKHKLMTAKIYVIWSHPR